MERTLAGFFNTIPQDNGVIVYGVGKRAIKYKKLFKECFGERLIGFCDKNIQKQREGFLGLPVLSPDEIPDKVSIVIMAYDNQKEIMEELSLKGFNDRLYATPIGSRENIMRQYFEPGIIMYDEREIFIDCGGYDLGTTIRLREHCLPQKVYVYEPEPGNLRLINDRIKNENLEDVVVISGGCWSENTTLRFNSGEGSSSSIDTDGGDEISAVKIDDSVNPDDRITFIKMDIEGAELEALKGAERTIRKYHPKLAICIYHKSEDMVDIPLWIKSIHPDYKLYVRHYANDDTETVLYAV